MPYFINVILNILTSGLPCCILALGIFLTYRLLDFADLTAEGSFLIGGALATSLISVGVNAYIATFLAIIAGVVCGLITALLHTKLNIPKLLSGIITLTATSSIALLIIGISDKNSIFKNLVTLSIDDKTIYSLFYISDAPKYNLYIETIIMIVFVIITSLIIYYFFGTEYGMAIRATGMNETMAKAQGINSKLAIIVCVCLSNALIALAGAMFAQDRLSMDIKGSSGFLVIGLSSILIGEAIFGNKTFKNNLISVILGAIVYFVIITLAIELGFPTELKNLLYAFLIALALCLPTIKNHLKKGDKAYVKN
ncbi:MAG: ABC transporter permease [Candidatus Caccosoma sp.]|nr:ABC transporter permease [Candidatus Caccosoma sp.]